METKTIYEDIITNEDTAYINSGKDDSEMEERRNLIISAMVLNGTFANAESGIASSYIDEHNYMRRLVTDSLPANVAKIVEQALNWDALGRGKGGLAGSVVRYRLRDYFKEDRECITITKVTPEHLAITSEYAKYSQTHSKFAGTWHANAYNVLGLATSSFIRECHHWNAQNVKPIRALLGSLGQENELNESEYRKLFYLSIHPLPLEAFKMLLDIADNKGQTLVSDTVKSRLDVAPSGYADVCALGLAGKSFIREEYANKCQDLQRITDFIAISDHIKANAINYHPFAASMGVEPVKFDKVPYMDIMIVLAAYTKTIIGGTLANSPAVIKFIESQLRQVNKLCASFRANLERRSDDLLRILAGEEEITYDNIVEKINPIVKLADRLKKMSDEAESPISQAADKLYGKVVTIVERIDKPVGTVQYVTGPKVKLPKIRRTKTDKEAVPTVESGEGDEDELEPIDDTPNPLETTD